MILQLFSKVRVILNKSMAGKQVDGSLGKALLAPRSMARGCSVLPKNCSRFLLHLSSWQGFVPSGFLHGTHWTYKYLVSLFIFNFISLVPHGLDSPLSLSPSTPHTQYSPCMQFESWKGFCNPSLYPSYSLYVEQK